MLDEIDFESGSPGFSVGVVVAMVALVCDVVGIVAVAVVGGVVVVVVGALAIVTVGVGDAVSESVPHLQNLTLGV